MLGPAGLSCSPLHYSSVLTPLRYKCQFRKLHSSGGHQAVPVLGTLATASTTLGQHRHGLDIHCHYTTTITITTITATITINNNNNISLVEGMMVVVVKLLSDLTVPHCPQWGRMCWSGLQGPPRLGLV